MLLRNRQGEIVEINRQDFLSDEEYYSAILKVVSGKSMIAQNSYVVTRLVKKVRESSKQ